MEKFAREDKKVERHLEVIRRKELLELVLGKMEGLKDLRELDNGEARRPQRSPKNGRPGHGKEGVRGPGGKENGRGGWSLF